MPKKNRAYKKGRAHRDARLFIIVAEGEREDVYFPDAGRTKLYRLGEQMLELLGNNWV